MALQKFGNTDMDALLDEMEKWSKGDFWVQRAAIAAICEPRLMIQPKYAEQALNILARTTALLQKTKKRDNEGFRVLRRALGYCWSVAVVAFPQEGKSMMEYWFTSSDKDIRWIMRENPKKNRLVRMDAKWVEHWEDRLAV